MVVFGDGGIKIQGLLKKSSFTVGKLVVNFDLNVYLNGIGPRLSFLGRRHEVSCKTSILTSVLHSVVSNQLLNFRDIRGIIGSKEES